MTAGNGGGPIFVIFTDLDGTLLDHDTYEWKEAQDGLQECRRRSIPVIAVSSKTRAEIVGIRQQLGVTSPFISENGGGVFFERGTFGGLEPVPGTIMDRGLCKLTLGSPYEELVECLGGIKKELGWNIRGFSDMSLKEISQRTGLKESDAHLASRREFDEPFVVIDPQTDQEDLLLEAARKRGYRISMGGRFYHLHGENEKGHAVDVVTSLYVKLCGDVITVALGDSPNDFPMLQKADIPILVRSHRVFTGLEKTIVHLRRTRERGPRGWNSAVLDILEKEETTSDG